MLRIKLVCTFLILVRRDTVACDGGLAAHTGRNQATAPRQKSTLCVGGTRKFIGQFGILGCIPKLLVFRPLTKLVINDGFVIACFCRKIRSTNVNDSSGTTTVISILNIFLFVDKRNAFLAFQLVDTAQTLVGQTTTKGSFDAPFRKETLGRLGVFGVDERFPVGLTGTVGTGVKRPSSRICWDDDTTTTATNFWVGTVCFWKSRCGSCRRHGCDCWLWSGRCY